MTCQTISTAAHSFGVENVGGEFTVPMYMCSPRPQKQHQCKETSDSDIFVLETEPYVAQAHPKLAMCLPLQGRTTGVPVFEVLDDQIQCLTHTFRTVPSEL